LSEHGDNRGNTEAEPTRSASPSLTFTVEIALGNDAMQAMYDVQQALNENLLGNRGMWSPLEAGEHGAIKDVNGNTVGRWEVRRA